MSLNEADTRAKLIDPRLKADGWSEALIKREHYFTAGRVILIGDEHERLEPKKADYLLSYEGSIPIAVVEAKPEGMESDAGIGQAKDYAAALDLLFAYSSNGHGIEEFDFITNTQQTVESFPPPDELWQRILKHCKLAEIPSLNPLTFPYFTEPGGKIPRYYQEVAIRRVIEAVLKEQKHVLLAMATGTGKTFVAFQIAWKLLKTGGARRVLFLADRVFLRDQAYNAFAPFGDARAVIKEGKAPKTRDVYFSIYQAMYSEIDGKRLFEEYPPDFFDLIIIDECHRSGFGSWNEILQHFSGAVQLGMTATPKRADNIDTYEYFGKPVYSYSLGQGIDDGFLATYKVHRVQTNIDKEGLYLADAYSVGAEVFVPEDADIKDVYYTEDFERDITLPDRTAAICQHLAELLRTFGPMEKTMVFCVDMAHANLVKKELQNHFSDLGFSDYAVRIVSEEPAAHSILERFADPDKPVPVVATTADLLTTGVDVPAAKNVVFIKSVSSPVVFKQMVGRGSRISEAAGKFWFRVIDYTNATRLFDDWDRPPKGPGGDYVPGATDRYLQGFVVNEASAEYVSGAQVTVLTGPNRQKQKRTDEGGYFAFEELPAEVKVRVSAGNYRPKQLSAETAADREESLTISLKQAKDGTAERIKVEGLTVEIAEETYLELASTGQRLTEREYISYAKMAVAAIVGNLVNLQKRWLTKDERDKLKDELKDKDVSPRVLATLIKRPDVDEVDMLAHVGFDRPLITRDERAKAVKNLGQDFLNSYGPEAREVLEELLDKYRLGGVDEFRPEVFHVWPFSAMGGLSGVAQRFGGIEKLIKALAQLEERLYGQPGVA